MLTVLYDSDCGICTAAASLLGRHRSLTTVAIQSPDGGALLSDLEPARRLDAFHVVSPSGERWTAGAALAPLARQLPGGRPLAYGLDRFPVTTERAYSAVARNRHRLSAWLRLRACAADEPHRASDG